MRSVHGKNFFLRFSVIGGGVFFAFALYVSVARATDYSGTSFIIRDPVISFIAGRATSTNFELYTSDGGSTAGESSSTNFTTRGGFLYFAAPPPPPPPPAPTPPPPPPAGGGGGGGPPGTTPVVITVPGTPEEALPPATTVIFRGYASPLGTVHVLQDGSEVGVSAANADGTFTVTVEDADPGSHGFLLYVVDGAQRQSQGFSITLDIIAETTTDVARIILSPTLEVNRTTVDQGTSITLTGTAVPGSQILVDLFYGQTPTFASTTADAQGNYTYTIVTNNLRPGSYRVQVHAGIQTLGLVSSASQSIQLVVASPILRLRADLDTDGRVDAIDFATMLFWYRELNAGRRPSERPAQSPDLSGDGAVTLTDFSILAFYWTS